MIRAFDEAGRLFDSAEILVERSKARQSAAKTDPASAGVRRRRRKLAAERPSASKVIVAGSGTALGVRVKSQSELGAASDISLVRRVEPADSAQARLTTMVTLKEELLVGVRTGRRLIPHERPAITIRTAEWHQLHVEKVEINTVVLIRIPIVVIRRIVRVVEQVLQHALVQGSRRRDPEACYSIPCSRSHARAWNDILSARNFSHWS